MEVNPAHTIFLSASVPHRPKWTAESKPAAIEEAIVSVARAVFAHGGRLLFGGHPSVSPLIASVAGEYFPADPGRRLRPVVTFQSQFFPQEALPNETWELYRMGWTSIIWTPKEARQGNTSLDLSLETMRRYMLLDSSLDYSSPVGNPPAPWKVLIEQLQLMPPKAMVAIGGMEGVADEAAMFLDFQPQAPVCSFTSTAGAAARLFENRESFEKRLWPDVKPDELEEVRVHRAQRLQSLTLSSRGSKMIEIEHAFRSALNPAARQAEAAFGGSLKFEPYALMSQWLLDRLDIR